MYFTKFSPWISNTLNHNVSDLNAVSPSKAVHNHNVCIPPFKPVKPIQKVQDKTTSRRYNSGVVGLKLDPWKRNLLQIGFDIADGISRD
jgi:hypothetical protein